MSQSELIRLDSRGGPGLDSSVSKETEGQVTGTPLPQNSVLSRQSVKTQLRGMYLLCTEPLPCALVSPHFLCLQGGFGDIFLFHAQDRMGANDA